MTREDELERELDRAAKLIMLSGPLTVYRAQKHLEEMKRRAGKITEPGKKDPPLATVHGHFRILEESGEIAVYPREKTGRKEKYYGMTLYGFLWNLSTRLVETKFESLLTLWLNEKQFNFILPNEQVLKSIRHERVVLSLGRICLAISDGLPDTRDLLDFLRELGYNESDPHVLQFLMQFALGAGFRKNPEEIIAALRVLCNTATLPRAREEMQLYIESQRKGLVTMEEMLGLVKE